MAIPITYAIYLVASIVITVWVGHHLHRRGRVFLLVTFQGNEKLADAVNDLLIVGFYLVNIAFVTIALKFGIKPQDVVQCIEFLASKVGVVMVVLSAMHFGNLLVFAKIIQRSKHTAQERELQHPA